MAADPLQEPEPPEEGPCARGHDHGPDDLVWAPLKDVDVYDRMRGSNLVRPTLRVPGGVEWCYDLVHEAVQLLVEHEADCHGARLFRVSDASLSAPLLVETGAADPYGDAEVVAIVAPRNPDGLQEARGPLGGLDHVETNATNTVAIHEWPVHFREPDPVDGGDA